MDAIWNFILLAALCGDLLVPTVAHITENSCNMNLYCVLKRSTYFVKLLSFQSRDDKFDPLEFSELLSVWRTSVDISKLSEMNELNQ
jgi:hypothetical protein